MRTFSYLQWQRLQHGHVGLVVRYDFVARLVSTSHVETSALVRDQFQVWLYHDGVKVLYTTVVLRNKGNEIMKASVSVQNSAR